LISDTKNALFVIGGLLLIAFLYLLLLSDCRRNDFVDERSEKYTLMEDEVRPIAATYLSARDEQPAPSLLAFSEG
jgi:hypothetical protein